MKMKSFGEICHFCLRTNVDKYYSLQDSIKPPSFLNFEGCTELQEVLQKILKMDVKASINNNSMPEICQGCHDELQLIYKFMYRCVESEKMLYQLRPITIQVEKLKEFPLVVESEEFAEIGHGTSGTEFLLDIENIKRENSPISFPWLFNQDYFSSFEGTNSVSIVHSSLEQVKNEITDEEDPLSLAIANIAESVSVANRPELSDETCKKEIVPRSNNGKKPRKLYERDQCNAKYRRSLNVHNQAHAGKGIECDQCGRHFRSSLYLRDHLNNFHNVKIKDHKKDNHSAKVSEWKVWHERLRSRNSPRQNMRNHYGIKHKCDQCDKEYARREDLNIHKSRNCKFYGKIRKEILEPTIGSLTTKHAAKDNRHEDYKDVFKNIGNRTRPGEGKRRVIDTVMNARKNLTNTNGKKYSTTSHFKKSRKAIDPYNKGHVCDECGKQYKSPYMLKVHKETHLGKKYKCKQCWSLFGAEYYLENHKRAVHKIFECNVCNLKFANNSKLYQHKIIIHLDRNKYYHCDKCNVRPYKCRKAFWRHKLTHAMAANDDLLQIEKSSASIQWIKEENNSFKGNATTSHTKKSRKSIDPDYKTYACDQCSKKYRNLFNLKVHKEIHLGKKYKCNQCNHEFKGEYYLKTHKNVFHPEDKRYECDQCHLKYKKLKSFRAHKQTHAGQKFKCDECNRVFDGQLYLLYHEQLHHRNFNRTI